ncbi:MAG: agmatine deiminase family protein [Planctomycetaceae bacterium]
MSQQTAAQLGFHMPAEWEPQEAVWLSWPHRTASWPGAFQSVVPVFVQIAKNIAATQLVRINVGTIELRDQVDRLLRTAGVCIERVRYHMNPTNDAWCRDHGPIYVVRDTNGGRERAILDWDYNAWGGKYPPFDSDNAIPSRIAEEFGEYRFVPGMILEGGSIDVNGAGTVITSEACLLNKNRNPSLTREQIEQRLRDYLGVQQVLWMGDGIVGDDTDGHIDDMTRFVSRETIVTVVEDDPQDVNYHALMDNLRRLRLLRHPDGSPFRIVTLPMPGPVYFEADERLPASYANFLIINEAVLVPTYRDENDQRALDTLQQLFPTRKVIGIDSTPLVWGLGSIHCVTQQQPKGQIVPPAP